MFEVMVVPLMGLLITLFTLAVYYFSKYIQIRRGYEQIENPPPHIYTTHDVKTHFRKYQKLCDDLKALQEEGFALRNFLKRMKKLALLVDRSTVYLHEENEIFRHACTVFKRICEQKRGVEIRARYQQNFKEKFQRTQIKILQLLPREMFFSCSRLFLPPSPLNRVSILVKHLKMLRDVNEKRITHGKKFTRKRRMTTIQLHYYKKQKKARIEKGTQESFDEAKMRILSMADDSNRFQAAQVVTSEKDRE